MQKRLVYTSEATPLDRAIHIILAAQQRGEELKRYAVELKFILSEAIDRLTGMLRRKAGPRAPQIAEEVASEWVADFATNGLPTYDPSRPIGPFLRKSLRNKCARKHRDEVSLQKREENIGRHRAMTAYTEADGPQAAMLSEEFAEAIQIALFTMSAKKRHILDLSLSPLDQREIAKLLKITPGAWRSRCFHARDEFVKVLCETCSELGLPLDVLPFRLRALYRAKDEGSADVAA